MTVHVKYPPQSYMNILILDPGTGRAGLLALGVPPPPSNHDKSRPYIPRRIYAWGEAMIYHGDSDDVALAARDLTRNNAFEVFIIDQKMGQQRPPGFSMSITKKHEKSFAKYKIRSLTKGPKFEYSNPNIELREVLLKEWMRPPATLRVMPHMTMLDQQMSELQRMQTDLQKRDGKAVKELVDCLEYGAAWFEGGLYYNPPEQHVFTHKDRGLRRLGKFIEHDWGPEALEWL